MWFVVFERWLLYSTIACGRFFSVSGGGKRQPGLSKHRAPETKFRKPTAMPYIRDRLTRRRG